MKSILKPISLTAALILGACSHYSEDLASLDSKITKSSFASAQTAAPQDIAPAAGGQEMAANTATLGQYLARDYYELAKYENDKAYDYKAAKLFTTKAAAAAKGEIIAPSRVASFDVPKDKIPELNEARESLLTALRNGGMAGYEPQLAKAQTNFDCWLDRAEESVDEKHYASCKEGYEQAMAQIIMPAAGSVAGGAIVPTDGPQMTEISFAPNADVIDAPSAAIIGQLASFLSSPEGAGYTAVITGFTPLANATEAERLIATSRALNVRQALIQRGINASAIKPQIAPVPQTANVVPVAGGTAADHGGLDRKVQIHLVASPTAATVTTTTVSTIEPAPAPSIVAPATTTIYNTQPATSSAPAVKTTTTVKSYN